MKDDALHLNVFFIASESERALFISQQFYIVIS